MKLLYSMLPALRSGMMSRSASPLTRESIFLMRAASAEIALSNPNGPSTIGRGGAGGPDEGPGHGGGGGGAAEGGPARRAQDAGRGARARGGRAAQAGTGGRGGGGRRRL